jgi:M6 family metalloprotease-like protein
LSHLTAELRQRLANPREEDLTRLVQQRAEILARLMRVQRPGLETVALSEEERRRILAVAPHLQALLEQRGEWHGELQIVVMDDFAGRRSTTLYTMHAGGQRVELVFPTPSPRPVEAGHIQLKGLRVANVIAVDSYQASTEPSSLGTCSTSGEQRTLVILTNMPSRTLPVEVTPAFVTGAFFGSAPSFSSFLSEVSYGMTTATGDVVGPVTLPQDYTCDQAEQILQAAVQAIEPSVDATQYKRLFVVLPQIPNCPWAGWGDVGCWRQVTSSRGTFNASASWIIANTERRLLVSVSAHEAGHNLGLQHAASVDYDSLPVEAPGVSGIWTEYGDVFSNMGISGWALGHWAARHKLRLGWLASSNVLDVEVPGTFTVQPLEDLSSGPHALRIRRNPLDESWLWVEYRRPTGYDADLPPDAFSGAMIRYEDSSTADRPNHTALLDFTPGSSQDVWADFRNAPLPAGSSWADPFSPLTLTVSNPTASGISVSVQYDTPCAFVSSPEVSFGPAAATGSLGVSASTACSWVASSAQGWVQIISGKSGTGSGTVQIAVAENPGPAERIGALYVGRQKVSVRQAPPLQAVSVEPSTGTGASQTFTMKFSSPSGVSELIAEVLINSTTVTSNACYVRYEAATRELRLRNDADTSWSDAVPIGSTLLLRNGRCAISAAGSSAEHGAFSLTLAIGLSFTSGFLGTKNLYLKAQAGSSTTGWQLRGSWTVDSSIAVIGVLPGAGEGQGQTFEILAGAAEEATYVSILFSTSSSHQQSACFVQTYISGSGSYSWLLNDAGTDWGSGGSMGSSAVLQNSQCAVHLQKSSVSATIQETSVRVSIWFKPSFAGQKFIFTRISGSPFQLRGHYIVAFSSNTGPAAVFRDSATSVRLLTLLPSPQLFYGGGLFDSDPSAAQTPEGAIVVVGRDAWGSLWANTLTPSTSAWSGWSFGGGLTKGQPSIAVGGDGKAWVVARDNWNSYWIVSVTPGRSFGSWLPLAGVFSQDPAVAACADGSIYIIGTDVWRSIWSGRYIPGLGFQGWRPGGGIIRGKPAVTCGTDAVAYVAVRDDWNSLWIARVQGDTWLSWSYGGGIMSGDPQVASARNGEVSVLLKDTRGSLWRRSFSEGSANGWLNWTMTGGLVTDFGAAGSLGEVFVAGRSSDNSLWWYRMSSGQWSNTGFTGIAAGPVAAAQR